MSPLPIFPHHIQHPALDLALVGREELGGGAGNGGLARLLDLAGEDDLVALLPHLGDDGLAGVDGAGEADLDVLDGAEPVCAAVSRAPR